MAYKKKTYKRRTKKNRSLKSRRKMGGMNDNRWDIEMGVSPENVLEAGPVINENENVNENVNNDILGALEEGRSPSPPNFNDVSRRNSPRTTKQVTFDVLEAAEEGSAGPNLVGGRRRRNSKRRNSKKRNSKRRKSKENKKSYKKKKTYKKKSLFNRIFGI
jgi:hypothetical protein